MNAALARLRSTVESFIAYIDGLPAGRLAPAAWGPREVLVHLVFWHETFVAMIEALQSGREPDLPRGTFAELNAQAVTTNRSVPVPDLIRRFRAAQSRLEQLAPLAAERSLAIPVKAGSKPRTAPGLIEEIEAHVRNHEVKLRRQHRTRA